MIDMPLALEQSFSRIKLYASRVNSGLDNYFDISGRQSTIPTEVIAGITIYLSLSFVFILNPTVLGAANANSHGVLMSQKSILIATVLVSSLATISMGIFANLPLAVGPGIEVSAFFTYVLVNRMHLSWEESLFAVVLSGGLNVFMTSLRIRQEIIEAIPPGLKSAFLLSIGVFVFLVGLKLGGVVDVHTHTMWLFLNPDFWKPETLGKGPLVLLIGLAVSAFFNIRWFRLPWGTLVGIVVGAIACHIVGINVSHLPTLGGSGSYQTFLKASPSAIMRLAFWNGVIILFVVDFVGGISKIYALTEDTHIKAGRTKVPGLKSALIVDGLFTFIGGWLGTSSLIAFVESRVGIQAGGQTGLAAVVCGVLMMFGGMFSKILVLIPPEAASGVLVYVGILLIALNAKNVHGHALGKVDFVIAVAMACAVLVSFQFDSAMLIGFLPYFWLAHKRGASLKSTIWLGIVTLTLLITVTPEYISIIDIARGFPNFF